MEGIADVILAIGTLLAAIGALIVALRNSEKANAAKVAAEVAAASASAAQTKIIQIDGHLFEIGKSVDGRLAALLELTKSAALAEGKLIGAAEQKANPSTTASEQFAKQEVPVATRSEREGESPKP